MRIYLDNCCFNRPFDDQSGIRIKLETDAKLFIQSKIQSGAIELSWSYMLDFENEANPFEERKATIQKWKAMADKDVTETDAVLVNAVSLFEQGLRAKDALHVACAIVTGCEYFLTTDDLLLKKMKDRKDINVLNPVDFVTIIEQ